MSDFSAGPCTHQLWQEASPIIHDIEKLPFLQELVSGHLNPEAFLNYLLQDDLYLAGYRQAMAMLAAKAGEAEQAHFWATSITTAITAEEQTHQAMLADHHLKVARQKLANQMAKPEASPTTLGYVSYLKSTAALAPYSSGVAGVLPCFWIYSHIGKYLVTQSDNLAADHPYKAWINMYDDDSFHQATRQAITILEFCLDNAADHERHNMHTVFLKACEYEWHFWHSAHQMQRWERLPHA